MKFFMVGERSSQSVLSHLRCCWAGSEDGAGGKMVVGTWSEPVEGRDVSQPLTEGRSRGLAKGRSIAEGHAFPERGNLVYTPGELRRGKPPSATNSKYGADAETSWEENARRGSARGLWMFRSRTTKGGTRVSGKRHSGGTQWTLRSAELIE